MLAGWRESIVPYLRRPASKASVRSFIPEKTWSGRIPENQPELAMAQAPTSMRGRRMVRLTVVKRRRLTPQSLAYSIGYRADRRHSTVPNNTRLPSGEQRSIRMDSRPGRRFGRSACLPAFVGRGFSVRHAYLRDRMGRLIAPCREPSARTRAGGLPPAFPFTARGLPAGDPKTRNAVFTKPAFCPAGIAGTPPAAMKGTQENPQECTCQQG